MLIASVKPRTRDAVLWIAQSQLGVMESPAGSNNVKYNTEYYGKAVKDTPTNKYPWCMAFVWWVFHEAGFNLYKTASCNVLRGKYQEAGQWVTSGYKAGDIVMLATDKNEPHTAKHCGIIISVNADGSINSVEGNTGVGNDANGGAVLLRRRDKAMIVGACRPGYNK